MIITLTRKVKECKNDDYVLMLASVSEDGKERALSNVLLKKKYIPELIEELKKYEKKGDNE